MPQKNDLTIKDQELLTAAENSKWDLIMPLLLEGANINAFYSEGNNAGITVLSHALEDFDADNISKILIENGADVNAVVINGFYQIAGQIVLYQKWDILRLAIDHGLDINARFCYEDINSCNLFHVTLCKEWDIVRILIENGADIENGCIIEGIDTPSIAWLIANFGPNHLKDLLITKGVDIESFTNEKNGICKYMLFFSAVGENVLLKQALDLGADVNISPEYGIHIGKTALWFMSEPYFFCRWFDIVEMIEYLIMLGANLNVIARNGIFTGASPLWMAAFQQEWDSALKLIKAGADSNLRPTDGPYKDIPAFFWILRQEIKTEPKLIELASLLPLPIENINVTTTDPYYSGKTLLFLAARYQCWDYVIKLIKAGADPNSQSDTENSIFKYLESNSKVQMLVIILLAATNHNRFNYNRKMLSEKQHEIYNLARSIFILFRQCPFVRDNGNESVNILTTRLGRISHKEALDYMADEWISGEMIDKLGIDFTLIKDHLEFIKVNIFKHIQPIPIDTKKLIHEILAEHYDIMFSNILSAFRKNIKLHTNSNSFDKVNKKNCHNIFSPIYERQRLLRAIKSGKDELFTKHERSIIYSNAKSINSIPGLSISEPENTGEYFKRLFVNFN